MASFFVFVSIKRCQIIALFIIIAKCRREAQTGVEGSLLSLKHIETSGKSFYLKVMDMRVLCRPRSPIQRLIVVTTLLTRPLFPHLKNKLVFIRQFLMVSLNSHFMILQ